MLLFLLLSCLHKPTTPIETGRAIGTAAGQAVTR